MNDIPHFKDFDRIKEEEKEEEALNEFKKIFNDNIKSVKDIGQEFVISDSDYEKISKNIKAVKKYANDLCWDFEINLKSVLYVRSSYPCKTWMIMFKKYS